MKLSLSQACDAIYAATAIATLSRNTNIALLCPDHSGALKLMVRDTAAAVIASLGKDIVLSAEFLEDDIIILFVNDEADNELTQAVFYSILTSLTLAQARICASDSPDTVVSLASRLPLIISPLKNILSRPLAPSRIKPCG